MKQLTDGQRATLEVLVDHTSLADVLEALGQIATDKAEHVARVWQDKPLARTWAKAAKRLAYIANTSEIQGAGK